MSRRSLPTQMRRRGFTIVELVIAVVVIGILTGIVTVSYRVILKDARSETAKVDAQTAASALLEYKTREGAYPASLDAVTIKSTGSTFQYAYDATAGTYCLTASVQGASAYVRSNSMKPKAGGCDGHGVDGEEAIVNLIPNPSFEVNTSGWTSSVATISHSTEWSSTGSASMKVVNTGATNAGDMRIAGVSVSIIPYGIAPGDTITVSATVHVPAAPTGNLGRRPGVLYWYSTDNSSWVEQFGPKAPATAGTHRISHTFTLPSNATGMLIGFGVASTTASQTFYYDDIMITKGGRDVKYADGTSPAWIWDGTPHASSSRGPEIK